MLTPASSVFASLTSSTRKVAPSMRSPTPPPDIPSKDWTGAPSGKTRSQSNLNLASRTVLSDWEIHFPAPEVERPAEEESAPELDFPLARGVAPPVFRLRTESTSNPGLAPHAFKQRPARTGSPSSSTGSLSSRPLIKTNPNGPARVIPRPGDPVSSVPRPVRAPPQTLTITSPEITSRVPKAPSKKDLFNEDGTPVDPLDPTIEFANTTVMRYLIDESPNVHFEWRPQRGGNNYSDPMRPGARKRWARPMNAWVEHLEDGARVDDVEIQLYDGDHYDNAAFNAAEMDRARQKREFKERMEHEAAMAQLDAQLACYEFQGNSEEEEKRGPRQGTWKRMFKGKS